MVTLRPGGRSLPNLHWWVSPELLRSPGPELYMRHSAPVKDRRRTLRIKNLTSTGHTSQRGTRGRPSPGITIVGHETSGDIKTEIISPLDNLNNPI
jgi:hypothetical protein